MIRAQDKHLVPQLTHVSWSGRISPSQVFDLTMPRETVADAHRATDERRAIEPL